LKASSKAFHMYFGGKKSLLLKRKFRHQVRLRITRLLILFILF